MSYFFLGITAEDIYDGKLFERMGLLFYKPQSEEAVCPQRACLLFGRGLSLVLGAAQCPAQTSVLWHRQCVCIPVCSWELGQMSQPCLSAQQPSLLLCTTGLSGWTPDHIYSWASLNLTQLVKKPLIITAWPCSGLVGLCAGVLSFREQPCYCFPLPPPSTQSLSGALRSDTLA